MTEEEWPEHECVTCMEGMDELVAKGQSWSCECCGFMVGTQDDHEYCGKNIDGTIVCNHCYDGGHKVTTMITLDGNEVIFNSTCQGEGNEKRLGDREYEITEEYVFGSEEGNAPIQDPMEFGEMANWTPLDGSEGLKRKRAEAIKVESVGAEEDIRMIYVRTREAAEEEAEKFIRHYFPADMKYAYQINATDEPNRWEMLYEQIPQGMESTFTDDYYDAEVRMPQPTSGTWSPAPMRSPMISNNSGIGKIGADTPSATIPVKGSEPSWVKPVATALGFALGFFGIHEIKKVL